MLFHLSVRMDSPTIKFCYLSFLVSVYSWLCEWDYPAAGGPDCTVYFSWFMHRHATLACRHLDAHVSAIGANLLSSVTCRSNYSTVVVFFAAQSSNPILTSWRGVVTNTSLPTLCRQRELKEKTVNLQWLCLAICNFNFFFHFSFLSEVYCKVCFLSVFF